MRGALVLLALGAALTLLILGYTLGRALACQTPYEGASVDFDYDSLNPGIRETVRLLRTNGFNTCDSGDGVTREFDCDPGFPYVHMVVADQDLVREADRLLGLMGIYVDFDQEYHTEDEMMAAPSIEGSYHPKSGVALLSLTNVSDKDWKENPR